MIKKFRYWDSIVKQLVYSDDFDFPTNERKLSTFFQKADLYAEGIIQQWTGLTDSQEVEVYEGDIIRFNLCDEEYELAEVEWHGVGWRAKTPNKNNVFIWYFDYKVVGNIFQTTELLEKC